MSHVHSPTASRTHARGPAMARLVDGTPVALRPLQHGEVPPLLAVFAGMSAYSRSLRYLAGVPRLPRHMVTSLTDVDGDRHDAWLASVHGEPVGLARYVRMVGRPATAELSGEVVDPLHGLGLGTVLLDTITTVAAARGVRCVRATLSPANTVSRRLLAKLGATIRLADGLLEAEGPLRLLDPPAVDRSAVLGMLCVGSADAALDIG